MFCDIYRSPRREQTYLYVVKKDDFSNVPRDLLQGFGTPQWVMQLPLNGEKKLANANPDAVRKALATQGYYLQLPPPPESLLNMHLASQKK